jgi:hypothetical protein
VILLTIVAEIQSAIKELGFSTVLSLLLLFFIYRLINTDMRRIESVLERIKDNLDLLTDILTNRRNP